MGRFGTIACALLLGLVGAAKGQNRPEFPVDPIGGCKPGAKVTEACPVRMECFADSNYPKGGRCECNPLYVKKPAKLPFDDSSEWDDGFSATDCEDHRFTHFVVTATHFVNCVLLLALVYTAAVVIWELVQAKALSFNSTSTGLIALFLQGVAVFFVPFIYFMNNIGLDKGEVWYGRRTILFTYFMFPLVTIVDFEIAVTWIDLWNRTSKMRKSSSNAVKVMRVMLRLLALFLAFGMNFLAANGGLVMLFLSLLGPNLIGFPFVAIGGLLITRTICPDRKDVANPNYNMAEAIRRGVKHCLLSKVFEFAGIVGLIMTNRHPQLGYFYGLITAFYILAFVVRMWGWLSYLIFACRKHLKKYASVSASPYLGFTTAALDKNLGKSETLPSSTAARSTTQA